MRRHGWMIVLFVALTACEPTATPLPVALPLTATAPVQETPAQPLRLALGANAAVHAAQIREAAGGAEVEVLALPPDPALLGTQYDLIAHYGRYDGWELSPVRVRTALIIGEVSPLYAGFLRRSIDTVLLASATGIPGADAITRQRTDPAALRTELANLGQPDGFGVGLGAVGVPGADALTEQLRAINIQVSIRELTAEALRAALAAGDVQIGLTAWTTDEMRAGFVAEFGADHIVELVSLPISYVAVEAITVQFTPDGWPIPERK